MVVKKSNPEIKEKTKRLKNAGLIDIDLRSVTDKQLQDKKFRQKLLRKINNFFGFLSGKEAVVKVPDKKNREALSSRGHRVKRNGLVFISKKEGEQVIVDKKGNITYSRQVKDRKSQKIKTEVIYEPNLNFKDVQSVEDAINLYSDMYKNGDHQIAFTYYGNISKKTFGSVKEAMLEIISYVENQNEIGTSLNPADIPEIMKSVQLVSYIDNENYGRARVKILDNKANFNRYFKKLSKKR